LARTQVSDLAPLAGLSSLQGLDLTATEVCDLGPLARLSSLRRLDIEASEVSDLAPLAKLSSLQKLRFAGTPVSDLAPLAGLSSLRRLDLSGTEASDLAPLAGLSSLQRLDLEGTQVSDLAPLTGLSSLELVDLRGTQVSDLGPVENIPHIKIVVENIPGLHLVPPSPRELLRDPGGPVPDRVSPEATATKIYELDMGNFRGFERERFWFPTRFTVLIGDNGTGKTAILEALAAGLGAFCSVFDPGCRRDIRDDDVRRVVRREGDTTTIEPQYPAWVRCEGLLAGEPLVWTFGLGMAAMAGEQEPEGERWAARLAGKLQQRVRDGEPVVLPVLAYYPSGRLWHQKSGEPTATLSPGSRTRGYTGCLDPESSLSDLLAWFKTREMQAIQEKKRPGDLEAVRRAVAAAMKDLDKGVVEVVYDVGADELVAVFADGRRLPFRMLSEGVRTMLAMVADIAWRAATLNPHLGSRAPVETPGIVLIDEIDLHLHPVWQRRVVADLRRAFPLIQFVATTHSPFIVQSLDAEQLVNLERREAPREASPGDRTLEQIAEDEMGVAYPERSWKKVREMHEAAAEYYRLLEKEPDSPDLPRLKRRLDERLAPFSDDPAFQLLVEMERRREGDRDDS
ncbi:MAG: AAA family ATPase, partial [Planctomycetes bacterium]|nr:AAA family ATPase [Planctomycetota bacterium]